MHNQGGHIFSIQANESQYLCFYGHSLSTWIEYPMWPALRTVQMLTETDNTWLLPSAAPCLIPTLHPIFYIEARGSSQNVTQSYHCTTSNFQWLSLPFTIKSKFLQGSQCPAHPSHLFSLIPVICNALSFGLLSAPQKSSSVPKILTQNSPHPNFYWTTISSFRSNATSREILTEVSPLSCRRWRADVCC